MTRLSFAALLSLFSMAACQTPFSAAVNGYDDDHEQAAAVVTLSDPQVYSRETLINDRLVEIAYLEELLDKSVEEIFEPQLRRDLQTLTGFVAQLNVMADPVAGAQIERDQDLADLRQRRRLVEEEAALVAAEAELLAERRRLEALERGETPANRDPPQGAGTGENPPASPASPTLPSAPAQTDTQRVSQLTLGELGALLNGMERIRSLMTMRDVGDRARSADIRSTPQERFRDRQAYREEIRAALADVNLDDGHDIEGNALYRLQFRATVMPGENRGQFASTYLTFSPPELGDREITDLYFAWLAYVNRELNAETDSGRAVATGLQAVGAYTGLFETVEYSRGGGQGVARLALPRDVSSLFRWALCDLEVQAVRTQISQAAPCPSSRANRTASPFNISEFGASLDASRATRPVCPTQAELQIIDSTIDQILEYQAPPLLILSMLVTAVEGGMRANQVEDPAFDRVTVAVSEEARLRRMQTANDMRAALGVVRPLFASEGCAPEIDREYARLARSLANPYTHIHAAHPEYLLSEGVVRQFRELVLQDSASTPGEMATFFARPVDQSQRISSVQGAANAIDLAFAMRQQMMGGGISGALGANFVRQAVGRIETLERAPIVVGFNDRIRVVEEHEPPHEDVERTQPIAGWVFGPTLQPARGGTRLEARQNLANHSVSIDLSTPGWWPWVNVRQESAWVANWGPGAAGNMLHNRGDRASREFQVMLPHNGADMEALTRHITGLGSPLAAPRINIVSPRDIQLCPGSTSVRIQVAGRNLWQGTEAYLNGVPADEVRVLPDMGGVDLQFPVANLPMQRGQDIDNSELVIWTRDNRVSRRINLTRLGADAPFCATDAPALGGATINQNWIASGAGFTIVVPNAQALARRHELRVEMRRYDSSERVGVGDWTRLGVDGTTAVTVTNNVVSVQLPAAAIAGFPDGNLVQLSLAVRARADAEVARHPIDRPVAYYGALTQTAVESAGAISFAAADPIAFTIIVTLPKAPHRRFNGFPEAGAPNAQQMSIRGELALAGANYVLESSGAWTAENPAADGRPRYSTQVRLASGAGPTFVAGVGTAGQPVGFVLSVMGAPEGRGSVTIKQKGS